ncbi:hypothetical protein ABI59_18125 [Acidobacteria bacterium Mor1]|nr:hypothetical protein ABI59_18125 [Acidobacteria bacterium Mor1]
MNDAQRIEAVLAGDRAAAEALIEDVERRVLAIARGQFRLSPEESEDVLLSLCEKLWRDDAAALRQWQGRGPFAAYVSVIASRACLMYLREKKRRTPEVAGLELDQIAGEQAATSDVERNEERELLARGLERLSERDRHLIRLRFLEERDYEDLTRELGISYGAARKGVHSAVTRLRRALADLEPSWFKAVTGRRGEHQ